MPKETYLARYSLIIKRLEKGPATFDQLVQFLETESNIHDKDFIISKRTLQRDFKDIYSQINIEIVNEKKGDYRYYIKSKPETQEHSQRLLESYQIINAINAAQEFKDIVFLGTRKPKGLEHFYGLLYAIKNKKIVNFQHIKFWDDIITKRKVHPLGLNESQGRWYLIAVDTKDDKLKTFGLDRINDLEISKSSFRQSYNYNLHDQFKHTFGITNDGLEKPETVRLKFSYDQGQYIKNFPLHNSQKIITENDNEVIIELYVFLSWDFIKEILSWGQELEVLSPKILKEEIKNNLSNTTKIYLRKNFN